MCELGVMHAGLMRRERQPIQVRPQAMLEARDLPRCDISDFLQSRMDRALEADLIQRAKEQQLPPEQVSLYLPFGPAFWPCLSILPLKPAFCACLLGVLQAYLLALLSSFLSSLPFVPAFWSCCKPAFCTCFLCLPSMPRSQACLLDLPVNFIIQACHWQRRYVSAVSSASAS